MFERPMFDGYPDSTRMFYARIIFTVMLNTAAVERGYFDKLLCDTDEIGVWHRFAEAIPRLREALNVVDMKFPPIDHGGALGDNK